jgi:hypothetical protein
MGNAITLTVNSVANKSMTAYSGTFVVSKMQDIRANLNEETAVTITDAGDTANVMSEWALKGIGYYEGQILYWSVETVTGTTREVKIYRDSARTNIVARGTAVIANNAAGSVFFSQVRESGISGSVTVTIGGSLTNDNDAANTLTLTNVTQATNLQMPGESQFMHEEGRERLVKYTVAETVAEIQVLIDAAS